MKYRIKKNCIIDVINTPSAVITFLRLYTDEVKDFYKFDKEYAYYSNEEYEVKIPLRVLEPYHDHKLFEEVKLDYSKIDSSVLAENEKIAAHFWTEALRNHKLKVNNGLEDK